MCAFYILALLEHRLVNVVDNAAAFVYLSGLEDGKHFT